MARGSVDLIFLLLDNPPTALKFGVAPLTYQRQIINWLVFGHRDL